MVNEINAASDRLDANNQGASAYADVGLDELDQKLSGEHLSEKGGFVGSTGIGV